MVDIIQFVIGPLENNCYVVRQGESCLVVDPGPGAQQVREWIDEHGLSVDAIILTHGHFDHITGIPDILGDAGQVPIYIHPLDRNYLNTPSLNGSRMIGENFCLDIEPLLLREGVARIGAFEFQVIHVPGHTPGGCAFLFGDRCLTGDSLFCGSIGRTDLQGGDSATLMASVKHKLMSLPPETRIHCGHGPDSSIGLEAETNPFLRWA